MKKIAINGLGRIGRLVLRHLLIDPPRNIEIVAANAPTPIDQLAYLIRYDSVHGTAPFPVEAGEDHLKCGSRTITLRSDRDPSRLAWDELGVDAVLECTGAFTDRKGAAQHLTAGASRVIISAPSRDADLSVVMGVNEDAYDPDRHRVVSNGSCTTNALAPAARVLHDAFGIEQLMATAIHAYTGSQSLVDHHSRRMRRGRAAAISLIPTTTGADIATTQVLPALAGRVSARAVRVPVPDGALVDIVSWLQKPVTVDEVNAAMREAAEGHLKGILGYTEDELVSADIIGDTRSGIVDSLMTAVGADRLARVMVWYDNEYGFARRMVDLASYMVSREES